MTGDARTEFLARRERIRSQMGGAQRIARVHAKGRYTIRERIDRLLDPGSFMEIGTFARSERPEAADATPGDGKIGGFGTIGGRPVAVAGDDVTVLHGSSSVVGQRRTHRLFELAVTKGHPYIFFGETGGARLPDTLGSEGFSKVPGPVETGRRARRIPMLSVIAGESFGGSSFQSALSDLVIQVRGTCLAVSSPRVIEIATGEQVDFQTLGGVEVHARTTGQIDLIADTEDDAIRLVQEFLGYLPANAWSAPPQKESPAIPDADPGIPELVPTARNRAYDMRRLLRRLADDGRLLELKPDFGRSLVTALGRLGGYTVGFIASNPLFQAGALDPDGCDKGTLFLCLCDAFNIPVIFLQDVPGFIVGRQAEHDRLLSKAIMFLEALSLSETPKVTVVVRKAFGLAYFSMCGNSTGNDLIFAWPGAEISFMDPAVGVNVVYADKLRAAADPVAERAALIDEWSLDTNPYGAAGIMNIDEIIDPRETRSVLARAIARIQVPPPPPGYRRPLSYWPTCL